MRTNRLLIDWQRSRSSTRAFIDEQIGHAGAQPTIAMELGSIEVIKRMVSLGFGVSIVPLISIQNEVRAGELCAAKVFTRAQSRKLGIAFPADGLHSLAAKVFFRMLKEHVRGRNGC